MKIQASQKSISGTQKDLKNHSEEYYDNTIMFVNKESHVKHMIRQKENTLESIMRVKLP